MKLFCDYINDRSEKRFQEHIKTCDVPQHKQIKRSIHQILVDLEDPNPIRYPRWQYWIDSVLTFLRLDGTNGRY
jgi:hypothetical protein